MLVMRKEEDKAFHCSYVHILVRRCYAAIALEGKTLPLVQDRLAQPQFVGNHHAAGRVWLENDDHSRNYAPFAYALPDAGSERAESVSSRLRRGPGFADLRTGGVAGRLFQPGAGADLL